MTTASFWSWFLPTTTASVVVNPNQFIPGRPDLTAVDFSEVNGIDLPPVGSVIKAVQPDDDPKFEFAGEAIVESVDFDANLIYVRVDWESFAERPIQSSRPDLHWVPFTSAGIALDVTITHSAYKQPVESSSSTPKALARAV